MELLSKEMFEMKNIILCVAEFIILIFAFSCGTNNQNNVSKLSGMVKIDGSSTVSK